MTKKKKVKIYKELQQSLADAMAYEGGQEIDLRVTELPAPPKPMKPEEIRRVRLKLHASQMAFARFLCVSIKAVQSWEQGLRQPQATALRLLRIAERRPSVLLDHMGRSGGETRQNARSQ